jgi:hypothetical protein
MRLVRGDRQIQIEVVAAFLTIFQSVYEYIIHCQREGSRARQVVIQFPPPPPNYVDIRT